MTLYRVVYYSGAMRMKTSKFMSYKECLWEVERFNALPLLDLERMAMYAEIEEIEV